MQAVITRLSVDRLTASVMPKVIDSCVPLEPEEKLSWDPSSFASPLYNPIDGGHQTRPSLKQSSEHAFVSPPNKVDSRSHTNTGGPYQHAHVKSYPPQVARARPDVPELPFYNVASSHALWSGYGQDAAQSSQVPHTVHAPSQSKPMATNRADGGMRPSLNSLTSEWNTFVQSHLDI
jgi:hypothetical protein